MSVYYVYIDGAFFAPVGSADAVETIRNYWAGVGKVVTYKERKGQ